MNRHIARRFLLALGLWGLLALGLLHPGNEWVWGPAGVIAFLAVFALAILVGPTFLEHGREAFRHWGRFIATSEILVMVGTLAQIGLLTIALMSYPEMSLFERVGVGTFGAMGLYGGAREVYFGLRPNDEQAARDASHRPGHVRRRRRHAHP